MFSDKVLTWLADNLKYIPSNGSFVWVKKGRGRRCGEYIRTTNQGGYIVVSSPYGRILLHRYVWIISGGELQDGKVIDHINGCKTDNRVENLRQCTPQENRVNSRKPSTNTTGYKWVRKRGNTYTYTITFKGQRYTKGGYKTAKEAYDAACSISVSVSKGFHRLI